MPPWWQVRGCFTRTDDNDDDDDRFRPRFLRVFCGRGLRRTTGTARLLNVNPLKCVPPVARRDCGYLCSHEMPSAIAKLACRRQSDFIALINKVVLAIISRLTWLCFPHSLFLAFFLGRADLNDFTNKNEARALRVHTYMNACHNPYTLLPPLHRTENQ